MLSPRQWLWYDLPLIYFDLLFRIVISSGCKDRKRDKRSQEEECVRGVSACFKRCDVWVSASLALNCQTEFGNLLFCSIPRWSVGEGRRGGAKKKRRQQQEPFSTCRGHGHGFQILQHHWVKRSETEYIIIARGKKQGEPKRGAESAWSLTGLTLVAFLCLKLGRSSCDAGDAELPERERERELWCEVNSDLSCFHLAGLVRPPTPTALKPYQAGILPLRVKTAGQRGLGVPIHRLLLLLLLLGAQWTNAVNHLYKYVICIHMQQALVRSRDRRKRREYHACSHQQVKCWM